MRYKRTLPILGLCFLALAGKAQTMDSLFVALPEAVLPMLEHNSRLDLLDLYNCGMKAQVYNDLNGEVLLEQKDSAHLLVHTTVSTTLEVQRLPKGKDTIYACVRTVSLPERSSQLLFLDGECRPVDIPLPEQVSLQRCWQPSDSLGQDRQEALRQQLLPAVFAAHWESAPEGKQWLVYEVSVDGLMAGDRQDALRCLRPLRFLWRDGRWEHEGQGGR